MSLPPATTSHESHVNLAEKIRAYHGAAGEHHRYRSWEHCYSYFQAAGPRGLLPNSDQAALHLAFYLASWGMYRGSGFLLQFAYTIHMPLVHLIASERFEKLWGVDMGLHRSHTDLSPLVLALIEEVRETYAPFALQNGSGRPSDTLVTKVILGTFGCVPACDELFRLGIKQHGIKYSAPNRSFIHRILEFCHEHLGTLQVEQRRIEQESRIKYPLMKLIDMHFWQSGFELARSRG